MGKKLTIEEINKRFKRTFKQEVIVLDYINRRTPMKIKCLDCGYEWIGDPKSLLAERQHSCPNCEDNHIVKLICDYCGKEFERQKSRCGQNKSGFHYCSRECGNRHKNDLKKQNGNWDNSLNYRTRAFENLPHECLVCGWKEDERILEVHHIDENHNNNYLENLSILCPICHRKITLGYYYLDLENKRLIKKQS